MAKTGDSIRVTFGLNLHNIEANLSLVAIVRAVLDDETIKESGAPLAHFWLEFVDIGPNDKMLLQSMVYQKMIEHPQSLL